MQTNDPETSSGVGAKKFEPYTAQSGARRLALQQFKGCAITEAGIAVAKGSANIPYPSQCATFFYLPLAPPYGDGVDYPMDVPTGKVEVLAGQKYFLNQFTVFDQKVESPTDQDEANAIYNDSAAPLYWMENDSMFKYLDWSGASVDNDRWYPGYNVGGWDREISYSGAAWMKDDGQTLTVDVLDPQGAVRATQTYDRSEFLAENSTSGHSIVSLRAIGIGRPEYMGDPVVHLGEGGFPAWFRSTVKIEFMSSTNPLKQITMPDLTGDGAIRVTWSAMKNHPFYFPVSFVKPETVAPTCYSKDDFSKKVVCAAGLDPTAELSPPKNGKFYVPGETFFVRFLLRDGDGNLLHDPDSFPSFDDYLGDQSNGLVLYNIARDWNYLEKDQSPAYKIMGPLQNAGHYQNVANEPPPYTLIPGQYAGVGQMVPFHADDNTLVGNPDIHWSNRQPIHLPLDAQSGTYGLFLKATRNAFGERISRGRVVRFQVGTEDKTNYPGRVGNCQICHRGVLSLENLRHGFPVDEIEGCKACHSVMNSNFDRDIHQIHMNSPKFPIRPTECVMCHLTKESALRANIDTCTACHPVAHGDQFWDQSFQRFGTPSRFTACSTSCHTNISPALHHLPSN